MNYKIILFKPELNVLLFNAVYILKYIFLSLLLISEHLIAPHVHESKQS